MVAVTEDDNPGQPPAASGTDADAAAAPASEVRDAGDAAQPGEPAGEVRDAGDAAQPGEPDAPAGAADADADAAGDDTGEVPGASGDGGEAPDRPERDAADLEQESEIAADYVEGLLDVADLDGDIDMDVEGDRALVSVVGATLQELVGPRGEVLEALQELTRLAVHRQTGERTRIMLDVGGYRARRRTELTALGRDAAEDVSRTGVARRLDAMTPFERKIIHDAVAAAGLRSESEGEEPNRRVVVLPAG
jgi:spoIIIJ-associated protein